MSTVIAKWPLPAQVAIIILCACFPLRAMEPVEVSDTTVPLEDLGIVADKMVFLPDGRTLVLVCNEQQRLMLFDTNGKEVIKEIAYEQVDEYVPVYYTDIAVSLDGNQVYLAGVELSESFGQLARLNLGSGEMKAVGFTEVFIFPSIAVSGYGQVYFADMTASTVTMLEDYFFEKGDRGLRRDFLRTNIFLEKGPVADIGVSVDGRFVVVSHANETLLSLVDTEYAEVTDEFGPGQQLRSSLPLAVLPITGGREKGGRATGVIVAEVEEDVLVAASINPDFQAFEERIFAAMQLESPTVVEEGIYRKSPLVVSADRNLEVIIVGNRRDNKALFWSSKRDRVVELESPPDDIKVSSDGNTAVILSIANRTLRIVRNPIEWSSEEGTISGSERIREVQKLLSALRYPVGTVDGLNGPTTRRAVRIFQESAGLDPSGEVDPLTLERIRSVAEEEAPVDPQGDPSGAEAHQQCKPIEPVLHCRERLPGNRLIATYAGATSEEVICPAEEGASFPIQVDRYELTSRASAYSCTHYHSCAFIRFRELLAYDRICRKSEEPEDNRLKAPSLILRQN